jgi:GH18 family chitinase
MNDSFIFNGLLQICVNISDGWKTFWDDNTMTAYALQGDKVITYDDERSIAEKVSFLIIDSSKAALESEMNNLCY